MKKSKKNIKKETHLGGLEDSDQRDNSPTLAYIEDNVTPDKIYIDNLLLKISSEYTNGSGLTSGYVEGESWIQTYSGRRINPLNPNQNSIVIQDIAHSLSNICRFTGHSCFYSVAQHCVLVSYLCDYQNRLYGLLHDATEYLCADLASPIKRTPEMSPYRDMEAIIHKAVCKRFHLLEIEPFDVKNADLIMLATEARDLLPNLRSDFVCKVKPVPWKIIPLPPIEAEKLFLERFAEIIN